MKTLKTKRSFRIIIMKEPLFKFVAGVCLLLMGVSKMGQPQALEDLELITFQKSTSGVKFKGSTDRYLTVILIGLVLVLWWLFSTWGIAG